MTVQTVGWQDGVGIGAELTSRIYCRQPEFLCPEINSTTSPPADEEERGAGERLV
jgi:hypothetical protein